MINAFGIDCCDESILKPHYNYCPKCGTELEHLRLATTNITKIYGDLEGKIKEVLQLAMYGYFVNDKPKQELRQIIEKLIASEFEDELLRDAYFKLQEEIR